MELSQLYPLSRTINQNPSRLPHSKIFLKNDFIFSPSSMERGQKVLWRPPHNSRSFSFNRANFFLFTPWLLLRATAMLKNECRLRISVCNRIIKIFVRDGRWSLVRCVRMRPLISKPEKLTFSCLERNARRSA